MVKPNDSTELLPAVYILFAITAPLLAFLLEINASDYWVVFPISFHSREQFKYRHCGLVPPSAHSNDCMVATHLVQSLSFISDRLV